MLIVLSSLSSSPTFSAATVSSQSALHVDLVGSFVPISDTIADALVRAECSGTEERMGKEKTRSDCASSSQSQSFTRCLLDFDFEEDRTREGRFLHQSKKEEEESGQAQQKIQTRTSDIYAHTQSIH